VVLLDNVEVPALLAPVVSLVRMVSEDRLVHLVNLVSLEDQDSPVHLASLASRVLLGSSRDHQASVVVQVCRDSLVHLVTQDSRAIEDHQVFGERLVRRAHLVVSVSMSLGY